MHNKLVKELNTILNDEFAVCSDIFNISEKKREVLVKGQVKELENILKVEEMLVIKMGKLEEEREKKVLTLSKSLNLKEEEITISKILNSLGTGESEVLKKSQQSLSKILKDIKELNDLNSKLINNSLDYINYSINLMTNDTRTHDNNYGYSGKMLDPKKRNFFDMKL